MSASWVALGVLEQAMRPGKSIAMSMDMIVNLRIISRSIVLHVRMAIALYFLAKPQAIHPTSFTRVIASCRRVGRMPHKTQFPGGSR